MATFVLLLHNELKKKSTQDLVNLNVYSRREICDEQNVFINCPSIYPFHPESQTWKVEWNQASSIHLTCCCCFPCQECKALCKEVDSKEALDCHLRGRNSFSPTFG